MFKAFRVSECARSAVRYLARGISCCISPKHHTRASTMYVLYDPFTPIHYDCSLLNGSSFKFALRLARCSNHRNRLPRSPYMYEAGTRPIAPLLATGIHITNVLSGKRYLWWVRACSQPLSMSCEHTMSPGRHDSLSTVVHISRHTSSHRE